jgi:hypothetical protein
MKPETFSLDSTRLRESKTMLHNNQHQQLSKEYVQVEQAPAGRFSSYAEVAHAQSTGSLSLRVDCKAN